MLKNKRIPTLSAGLAIALTASLGAPAAMAGEAAPHENVETVAVQEGQQEFTDTLERLFTEVLVLDEQGAVVSYDEAAAIELVGEEEAQRLTAAVQQSRQNSGFQTQSSQSFVDCMVENSVLGLVSGVASGSYAELIREKRWDELGERVWPKVARAGVTGGAVGVAAGLAVSSVQCAVFN